MERAWWERGKGELVFHNIRKMGDCQVLALIEMSVVDWTDSARDRDQRQWVAKQRPCIANGKPFGPDGDDAPLWSRALVVIQPNERNRA